MGDEARCSVRHGNRVADGKALLETDELVFRGAFRLAIPRREISSATAEDGRLVVVFGDETATFELGPLAARWAEKIRNPKTLLDKLGAKPGMRVSLVQIPDADVRALLRERGIEFADEAQPDSDVVLFGADTVSDLERLRELQRSLKRDGAVWVVAPKGGREPKESQVLEAGKQAGLVDVKVARFSETHTAHKFVIPRERR